MIYTINLHDIGEGVSEGEVIEWLKNVGDSVKQDEPVVIVMTDKVTVELPAPYPGTISKHYVKPGELSFRDQPLYDIEVTKEAVADIKVFTEKYSHLMECGNNSACIGQSQSMQSQDSILALPKVRHLARSLNIDLYQVKGTGSQGQITLDDIHRIQTQKNEDFENRKEKSLDSISFLEGDQSYELQGVRRLMARKMNETHIPQFSYFQFTDATQVIECRRQHNDSNQKFAIGFMPFFIQALSLTIKDYPTLNSSINGDIVTIHQQHNIGIAVASPQGLIVPVIKGVHEMDLPQIIEAFQSLKDKVQSNQLSAEDMRGATITISNFGTLGDGLWATPIIHLPEVAILAVAKICQNPVVVNNEIVIKSQLPLSWSFDHRVIDGELAAKISHRYCEGIAKLSYNLCITE